MPARRADDQTGGQRVPPARGRLETDAAEQIPEIDAAEQILWRKTGDACKATGVVLRPFLWVGKHRVGLGDLLKAFLGTRLFVTVRMVPQGQLTKGVLDRSLVGIAGDAEDFVIVAL